MQIKKIYLVRHCEYSYLLPILPGRLPFPLSDEGKENARKLHDYFQDKKIEKIYSSAVLRCKETIAILAPKDIPIGFDKRLLETHSAYQGFPFNDQPSWKHFFSHRDELGGESAQDILNRMKSFWLEIVKKPEKKVIVCSHGDPLFCLYWYLSGNNLMEDKELFAVDDRVYQPKGSIREIKVDEDGTVSLEPILTVA